MYLYSADGFSENGELQEQQQYTQESSVTVEFYKSKLEKVKNEEFRLRKKLKKLHYKSFQLSLLLGKKLTSIVKDQETKELQKKAKLLFN